MIYDWINLRFLLVVISFASSSQEAFYNLAVSKSDDPAGAWCLYTNISIATHPNPDPNTGRYLFPDFPRLGQDRQAVYLASNLFTGSSWTTFLGEEVIALRK